MAERDEDDLVSTFPSAGARGIESAETAHAAIDELVGGVDGDTVGMADGPTLRDLSASPSHAIRDPRAIVAYGKDAPPQAVTAPLPSVADTQPMGVPSLRSPVPLAVTKTMVRPAQETPTAPLGVPSLPPRRRSMAPWIALLVAIGAAIAAALHYAS